jgi:uncharacterized Fe-S center protein
MEKAKVYFSDLRASVKENLLAKIARLLDTIDMKSIVSPHSLVAVKLHFGEKGNTAFIRPNFIRAIVDRIRAWGGNPFLTDANTLYVGTRADSVSHLTTAIENGFAYAVVNAPLIIADGLRGGSLKPVPIHQGVLKVAYVGSEVMEADALVSVAHFKGHELSGFGGALKNIGMGCASRRGKLVQHSGVSPKVQRKKCIACGHCAEHCSQTAISIHQEKAFIDPKKCIGCGECILICSNQAIDVQWNADMVLFQKKMVEYGYAVLKNKKGKVAFLNFLTDISPACDCYGHNDAPIVPDIGILASLDPVAIDQASVDLVNGQTGLQNTSLSGNKAPGADKFGGMYPRIDWRVQLEYAEKLGMGSREYELVRI